MIGNSQAVDRYQVATGLDGWMDASCDPDGMPSTSDVPPGGWGFCIQLELACAIYTAEENSSNDPAMFEKK